jgi:hypothetical protein
MNFAVNYLAVIVAAIAGVVINALWYSVILKRQVDALRKADPTIAGRQPAPPMYGIAMLGQLLMAFVLAVLIKTAGISGLTAGLGLGAFAWLGLTLPPIAQVQTFGYRQMGFALVDASNWLIAAMVMGAILGAWQ